MFSRFGVMVEWIEACKSNFKINSDEKLEFVIIFFNIYLLRNVIDKVAKF